MALKQIYILFLKKKTRGERKFSYKEILRKTLQRKLLNSRPVVEFTRANVQRETHPQVWTLIGSAQRIGRVFLLLFSYS